MKKKLLLLFALFLSLAITAQVNPTLAVGLEKLTMNKGTIDVEVLTEIIMSKQKELKQEALKRFMFKLFPEANFTTKYYVQNCLNVLLNEKNPQVIEKEILELTTNYALSLGVAYAVMKSSDPKLFELNKAYNSYKVYSPYYQEMIIKEKENYFNSLGRTVELEKKIVKLESELVTKINALNESRTITKKTDSSRTYKRNDLDKNYIRELSLVKKELDDNKKKLARLKLREGIEEDNSKIIIDKRSSSLDFINKILGTIQTKKLGLDVEGLNETKTYLDDETNSLKNILQLNNYLKEVYSDVTRFDTLIGLESGFRKELEGLRNENTILSSNQNKQTNNKSTSKNKISEETIPFKNESTLNEQIGKLKIKEVQIAINDKIKNLKIYTLEIPFGIILDVVSLSLSDIEELQKKGFFKNKIDYRSSDFYLDMTAKNNAQGFRESLDNMKVRICQKIRPYVVNYDIINEFLKKNKGKQVEDILDDLRKESLSAIIPILNSPKWTNTYTDIEKTLHEINELEKVLNLVKNSEIITKPELFTLSFLLPCSSNCSATYLTAFRDFNRIKNTFQSFYTIVPDAVIKEKVENTIGLIPVNFVTVKQSDLKVINKIKGVGNIPLNKIEINANETIDSINTKIEKLINVPQEKKNIQVTLEDDIVTEIINLEDIINALPNNKAVIAETNLDAFLSGNILQINLDEFNEKLFKFNNSVNSLGLEIKNKNIKITDLIAQRDAKYRIVAESSKFYNDYLESVLKEMEGETSFQTKELDSLTISKASEILPKIYSKVKYLVNNNNIHMSDIIYLEDYIVDKMIELKVRDKNNDIIYNSIISHTKIIIPLLKIKALQNIQGIGHYDEELMNLFEFIANLNNLDKAETYQSIVNMLRDGSRKVQENLSEGEFKEGYTVFINAMKKYTLINPSEEYVEIDVVSFLTDLQQYYNRNNKSVFSLYLSLGLNQNFFFKNFKISETDSINNISFASEKIGVKWRIKNFKRFEGYENAVKDDVYLNKKAPFINEIYTVIYGSGLLYTLANTTTDENFDFPHVGVGLGMRFYNALDLNLIIGFPFVKNANFGDNAFYGIGLDIPLGEYLEKLGSKNK
jgi:hypothetical protein